MTSNHLENAPVYFPKLKDIFKQSILTDFELLFDDYVSISAKTSNSVLDLEKMAYWKYRGISKALKKYIDNEAKQNGEGGEQNDVQGEAKKMMNNAKANMPKITKPKVK